MREASLVANPGCYPTAILLAVAPLFAAGLAVPNTLIADAKSGVSGAGGRSAMDPAYSFAAIDHLRRQLSEHEAAWARWFAGTGISPIRVAYEELDAAVEANAAKLFGW